ncbi:MAG TPA: hypothetical protein VHK90_14555 [Thermoanaerobaculia bacterium]|nr:hypothetical protein [Thermoanaerobaculia bacterium]
MAIMIAPPFDAYDSRPADPGAWSATRLYPSSGQIVLQLGAQPPNRTGQIFAGATLIESIYLNFAGSYTFSATVEVGPLTLLPRGHTVAAEIIMGIQGLGGDDPIVFYPPGPNGIVGWRPGTFNLSFTVELEARTRYSLRAACGLMMNYSGTPSPLPYAEIIATYKNVSRSRVGSEAAETPSVFAQYERNEGKVRELKDAEIGAIDGINPKK